MISYGMKQYEYPKLGTLLIENGNEFVGKGILLNGRELVCLQSESSSFAALFSVV